MMPGQNHIKLFVKYLNFVLSVTLH